MLFLFLKCFQNAEKEEEPNENHAFVEDAADIDARSEAARREQGSAFLRIFMGKMGDNEKLRGKKLQGKVQ